MPGGAWRGHPFAEDSGTNVRLGGRPSAGAMCLQTACSFSFGRGDERQALQIGAGLATPLSRGKAGPFVASLLAAVCRHATRHLPGLRRRTEVAAWSFLKMKPLIRPAGAFPRWTGLVRHDLVVCALRRGLAASPLLDQCSIRSFTHLPGSSPDHVQGASDVRAKARLEPIGQTHPRTAQERVLERVKGTLARHQVPSAGSARTARDLEDRPATKAGKRRHSLRVDSPERSSMAALTPAQGRNLKGG